MPIKKWAYYGLLRRKIKQMQFLMLFEMVICFILSGKNISMQAADSMTDIRVGLKHLYLYVDAITVYNNSIRLGYCINNSYKSGDILNSSDGFTFTPAEGYFLELKGEYPTYVSARRAAEGYALMSTEVHPACISRGVWRLEAGCGLSKSEADELATELSDIYSIKTSGAKADNNERILVTGSEGSFYIDAGASKMYPQFKAAKKNKNGDYILSLGENTYRGRLEIGRYGNASVSAVNIINIEAYLYGVIPCEMVSTWPAEALKAQAVCARSYALSECGYSCDSDLDNPYNIVDTTADQVYGGYGRETAAATRAVNKTIGKTLQYKGQLVKAYYFSTSGGHTEDSEEVWSKTAPYYRGVPDLYETEPERNPWIVVLSKKEISKRLIEYGRSVGIIDNMNIIGRTASGRVSLIEIKGSEGKSAVTGSGTIRSIFGLESTKFKIITNSSAPDTVSVLSAEGSAEAKLSEAYVLSAGGTAAAKLSDSLNQYIVSGFDNLMNYPKDTPEKGSFMFAGMGYGHGVGMSQSGAKGLAEAGYSYRKILQYYYLGTVVG